MRPFIAFLILFISFYTYASGPEEDYEMVKAGKAVIVDVREKDEIKNGMIDKAVWLPLSEITKNGEVLRKFKEVTKDKKIFLYCRSGSRSERSKELLQAQGIKSKNIGGYETLKKILPTKKLFETEQRTE